MAIFWVDLTLEPLEACSRSKRSMVSLRIRADLREAPLFSETMARVSASMRWRSSGSSNRRDTSAASPLASSTVMQALRFLNRA